ncbi:ABC transporter substrate-binding protein [Desertibacillus haloalkaliphilus]|uniref:ABC transporter substrate-binding protein n=1 Tax=Desertibacillus haloalkaliphilus TaxID=1328930 RepID=UPI001C2750C8|nr:ABC transporter substrate-binding protein [Desertibacillus haloalkaliphilus]MBU8907180.1 ABC transporter substrate-binding protein [Desertibacillus haloalkaliphilus]
MKKWYLQLIVAVLAAVMMTACGDGQTDDTSVNEEQPQEQADQSEGSEEVTGAEFPVTVTDALDNEVTFEEKPERIVTLIPSNTEIAFALGLEDNIVGVTEWCNFPVEAQEKEVIGDMNFNVEKVLAVQPDLVLGHASNADSLSEGFRQLENAGVDVLIVNNANSIQEVYESIEMISQATGTMTEADQIITEMQETIENIQETAAANVRDEDRVKVWVEVAPAPEIFTTGKGTFMHEMLEIIQATNAAEESEGWTQYTEEEAVSLNPDVIITTYGFYIDNPKEQIMSRPAWSDVEAVKTERVYDVDSDQVTRSGPRLAKGVEELAKLIYPEVFSQ